MLQDEEYRSMVRLFKGLVTQVNPDFWCNIANTLCFNCNHVKEMDLIIHQQQSEMSCFS